MVSPWPIWTDKFTLFLWLFQLVKWKIWGEFIYPVDHVTIIGQSVSLHNFLVERLAATDIIIIMRQ